MLFCTVQRSKLRAAHSSVVESHSSALSVKPDTKCTYLVTLCSSKIILLYINDFLSAALPFGVIPFKKCTGAAEMSLWIKCLLYDHAGPGPALKRLTLHRPHASVTPALGDGGKMTSYSFIERLS